MSLNLKTLLPYIAVVVTIVLWQIDSCNKDNKYDSVFEKASSYKGEADTLRLKNGALVSSINTLKLQSEEQLKSIAGALNDTIKQMMKKFKSVNNVTYITNNFLATGDSSNFDKEIPCDFKPFKARYSDSTYSLAQTIHKDKFVVDSLFVPNKTALVFGRKKAGFMKYDDFVDENNSNPLMLASNIKNYTFVPEKKWHEKRWVNMLFGAAAYSAAKIGINALITR